MTRESRPLEIAADAVRNVATALDALRAAIMRDLECAVDPRSFRAYPRGYASGPTVRDRLRRAGVRLEFDMIQRSRRS